MQLIKTNQIFATHESIEGATKYALMMIEGIPKKERWAMTVATGVLFNTMAAEIRPLSSCCGDGVKDERKGDAICLDCKEACYPIRPRDFGFNVWPKEDDE